MRAIVLALLLIAGSALAQGAAKPTRPFVTYLCAAGGQRGTTVQIIAGGQSLRGANRVVLSGEGVEAKVIRFQRVPWLLNTEDRRVVGQQVRRLAARKLTGNAQEPRRAPKKKKKKKKDPEQEPAALPDHPMLRDLESMTPKELRRVAYEFLDPARRSQLSPQIAEQVVIEVRIAADAAPGERELRVGTPRGLSNPVVFRVGSWPEFYETEPNDYSTRRQRTLEPPCVVNGKVSFKDLDRFTLRARRGQKLVIEARARELVPYVADAVPGWFQATLALYDAQGNEVSFVDDFRFDPDPVILFDVPADGDYTLEIRDAIYRGRDDFVYRITVAERPFITSIFPLGGQAGSPTVARIEGWNLPWDEVVLDTWTGLRKTQRSAWNSGDRWTNVVTYAVDELPDLEEIPGTRQSLSLPLIVNGRITRPGEIDLYQFDGRAGGEVVAEIEARRLGSPLDSVLQLLDESGRVLAWNDDHPDKRAGLVTHQSDSHVRATLPRNGTYLIRVADAQGHGGPAYGYRLRVSPPRPDFAVLVTPASINAPGGMLAPITVHAVRLDGYEGDIDLDLRDAPPGFALSGARIPAGREMVRMTLAVPPLRTKEPIPLRIVGRAQVEGKEVTRLAIPAEDMMQAFGLRHLVPARQLMVDVLKSWRRAPPMRLVRDAPTRIPVGGSAEVHVLAVGLPSIETVEFKLSEGPAGVVLRDARAIRGGLTLVLTAERGRAKAGPADNLIVEAYAQAAPPKGKKKAKPRRYFVGVLPAIPVEIVSGVPAPAVEGSLRPDN